MPESAKVKKGLEAAATFRAAGATASEAKSAVQSWSSVASDPEASAGLKAVSTELRRRLELANAIENAQARESALAALAAVVGQYL